MWRWLTRQRPDPTNALDVRSVHDKASFLRFVAALRADFDAHPDEWENGGIPDYLFAIERWTEAWRKFEKSPNPWRHAAELLWVGRVYE